MMEVLEELTRSLHELVAEAVGNGQSVPLTKRNRSLGGGDFLIPLAGFLKQKSLGKSSTTPDEICSRLRDSLRDKVASQVNQINLRDGNLFLHVDRTALYKKVLPGIFEGLDSCMVSEGREQGHVSVHCLQPASDESSSQLPLHHLRSLFISDHLGQLLQSCGYTVSMVKRDAWVEEHLQRMNITSTASSSSSDTSMKTLQIDADILRQFQEKLRVSKYIKQSNKSEDLVGRTACVEDGGGEHCRSAGCDKADSASDINCDMDFLIDLKQFIEDAALQTGGLHYSSNISQTTVCQDGDPILSQIVKLHQHNTSHKCHQYVHVVCYQDEFMMQKVDLLWRMLEGSTLLSQAHLVHGGITLGQQDSNISSVEDLYESYRKETEESFRLKYGERVCGEGWTEMIDQLTMAAMKIDVLSTSARAPLHLSCPTSSVGRETKGVFVMYNCARLSTLFKHFEDAVKIGTYPESLPDVDEIDFSMLTDEGEWELFFNFILPYTGIVRSTIHELDTNKLRPPLQTHKICQFLHDLSRHLSGYYSRVHILSEPRAHLLPTMYARLVLLRAVQRVMHHALSLLSIPPISQL